jgi:hypothetical protein
MRFGSSGGNNGTLTDKSDAVTHAYGEQRHTGGPLSRRSRPGAATTQHSLESTVVDPLAQQQRDTRPKAPLLLEPRPYKAALLHARGDARNDENTTGVTACRDAVLTGTFGQVSECPLPWPPQ